MSSKLDASIFFRPSGWTGANQREPTTKLMEISVTCISNAVTEPCSLLRVVALPRGTDSLGTQHCANFESHSNRVTFETNTIRMTSSIQAHLTYRFP